MHKIKVENLSKIFFTKEHQQGLQVLKNINLTVEKGEFLAIVGPSGCGKTTFLNILEKFEKPTEGRVEVDVGNEKTGYMFQTPLLLPWRTVLKNVILGIEIQGKDINSSIKKAKGLLSSYGLGEFQNSYPHTLSGGMKQRVALIRTIITDPEILFLDEPFAALDFENKLLLEEDLYKIVKKKRITVVFVTHDIEEAIALADRVIVFSKRPATISYIHYVNMENNTPLKRRESQIFGIHFKKIWENMKYENKL